MAQVAQGHSFGAQLETVRVRAGAGALLVLTPERRAGAGCGAGLAGSGCFSPCRAPEQCGDSGWYLAPSLSSKHGHKYVARGPSRYLRCSQLTCVVNGPQQRVCK